MKKWIIVIVVLLVAFISGFIPVTKSDSFTINAPYGNVYREFTSPKNWLKWQLYLKNLSKSNTIKIDSNKSGFQITAPLVAFNLQNLGLGNFTVSQTQYDKVYSFSFILTPENTGNKTIISLTAQTNLFYYLSGGEGISDRHMPMAGLKPYMESTRQYYGFVIRKELTPEKLIAVKRGSFLNAELYQQSDKMLNQLNDFVKKNQLKIVSPLQQQYVVSTKDSTQIMIGLPIDKKAAIANGIEYMTMPKGRILVGYYSGMYKDKEKLYSAMRQYMTDNYIHPIIQPFERFDNNKLPVSDITRVNMQLIVPYM